MNKNKKIIIAGLFILVIAMSIFLVQKRMNIQEVSTEEPTDIVLDFYNEWLTAVQDTATDPYQKGLHQSPLLSKELRDRLKDIDQSQNDVDPILCQSEVPTRNAVRVVYANENETEILVTARPSELTGQAIVKLLRQGDGWYINSIECRQGEFGPDREFTFERDGQLLKSVPEPLDSNYWHLVFEENNIPGHVAPLLFDAESMCRTPEGETGICNPDMFVETAKVHLKGEMTESGVNVKLIEFKE